MKILAPGVEYNPDTQELLLLRCPICGKENYALNVITGICTWCGYDAHELIKEDIITIHLGRVVSEELYDQIVKDIIKLLDVKYNVNAEWHLDS